MISRRGFLKTLAGIAPILGGAGLCLSSPFWENLLGGGENSLLFALDPQPDLIRLAPTARFWTSVSLAAGDCRLCHPGMGNMKGIRFRHPDGIVKCLLCAQGCMIMPGERGRCRARMNVGGELKSLVYGRPMTVHVDPIEKKPFYHFLPGSAAFSLATSGCPLRCKFCQNWEISQASPEDYQSPQTPPDRIVRAAAGKQAPVIAFTYNEPTVFAEYMIDIAHEARKQGLRSVLISCGIMNETPLKELCEVLDGIKIDLKGYDEGFYRNVCGAELKPVLRSIKQVAKSRAHLEIVNLVVPTLNDSEKMLHGLIDWILGEVGPDVPVHFTRFHPDYQLKNLPPTPVETLERARETAMGSGMHYVYVGNVPDHPGNHTYCPSCGKAVIKRSGFFVVETHLNNGRCGFCGARIAGVWS
jgi:pyruvate formate lyase activating enzyme